MKKKTTNILNNLTLCIFTLNRHESVSRLIRYYSKFNLRIIVLDASTEANKMPNFTNTVYKHMPGATLQERLMEFANLVTTEYLVLSPDDDFFAIQGLTKTLDFLEVKHEYSCAQGLRIRFFDYPDFYWIPDYTKQMKLKFESENKSQRLVTMGKQMHYIYSVMKTNNYAKIVKCLEGTVTQNRDSFAIGEILFNLTLPVLGKHKISPLFYSARKSHVYEGNDINFRNWINNDAESSAVKFKKNLQEFYMREIPCSAFEADNLIVDMVNHFSGVKSIKLWRSKFSSTRVLIRRILLGSLLLRAIRQIRNLINPDFLLFFWILISHMNFQAFNNDKRYLSDFLRNNQIPTNNE
jgi:glycosyltransferase domain-containing protein